MWWMRRAQRAPRIAPKGHLAVEDEPGKDGGKMSNSVAPLRKTVFAVFAAMSAGLAFAARLAGRSNALVVRRFT